MPPRYDPSEVKPMVEELTAVGVESLVDAESVDNMINTESGTTLLVVNSVCGCAAGNCRPGVSLALQHSVIPDKLGTVFAGMDTEAVERARERMEGVPPSSPCIALFKDSKLIGILERRHIERMTAVQIAETLTKVFDEQCTREGPSVPPEVYDANDPVKRCGSSIPLFKGE